MTPTTYITTTDTDSPMNPTRRSSCQLILSTLFLAINAVSSSTTSPTPISPFNSHQHQDGSIETRSQFSEDQISRLYLQVFDDTDRSSLNQKSDGDEFSADVYLRKTSSLRGNDNNQYDFATSQLSSLQAEGHRSLQGGTRIRERLRLRKDHGIADSHFSEPVEDRQRLIIYCEEIQSQEDCISKLLRTYDEEASFYSDGRRRIEVMHNLKFAHALAVDVDAATLGKMANDDDLQFEKDLVRDPLVLEGSMTVYRPSDENGSRNLQEAQEIPWGLDAIQAQAVWREYGVKGKGVKICVLDSGVQASHEDFRQSKFDGYYGNEFVANHWYEDIKGHGTHIAGTIAASDNAIGIVGIAPEAETYIVRVFDDNRNFHEFANGMAYSTDLIAAATICKEWGADIINASLGGSTYSRIEEEFFKNLFFESGILTVAASGNGGDDRTVYPAAYEGVLSVGAVDESLNMAKFSTWDPRTTDVLAPGVDILSTFKDNLYATFSGTSMAAPHATGALALILSYINENQLEIRRQDAIYALKHTISRLDISRVAEVSNDDDYDDANTMGAINAHSAIAYLESYLKDVVDRTPLIPRVDVSSNRCDNEARLNVITDSKGDEVFYRLMSLSDKKILWFKGPKTLENYSVYTEKSCLEGPEDCYQFDIRDKGGDGISNGGGIEIIYNGHILYKGGDFGNGGVLKFGNCHD